MKNKGLASSALYLSPFQCRLRCGEKKGGEKKEKNLPKEERMRQAISVRLSRPNFILLLWPSSKKLSYT